MFWIAGIFVEAPMRFALWVVALAIEYLSPMARFWTPGLGASTTSDWDVEGGHLAERCGLFVIIALGESVLVTGAKFATLPWTPTSAAGFHGGLRRQRGHVVDLLQYRCRAGNPAHFRL